MMDIDAARVYLKTVMSDRFTDRTFERYIDETLAGDFAVEIANSVKGLEKEVMALTALCDGYRGERDAAQWSTDVLAEEVKTLQSELNRAADVIISAADSSARQEKLGQDLILENAKLRHALTRARAEGMEEAAKIAQSRFTPNEWDYSCAGDDIAAAIRSAAKGEQ